MKSRRPSFGEGLAAAVAGLFLILFVIALNLALLAGAIFVVVWVLRAMGVIA